jgi:hypothetical protein
MRYIGFVLFIVGLMAGWWLVALIGFLVFEATGITWMAAATSNTHFGGTHSNNNHGP